jgi:histidyl-tRNA synthetase
MAGYGYQAVEIPIIESADLFLIRAGDQIVNKLFTFDRYGQQLALRPEFTAAAAHYYAQQETMNIARWQFYGPIFEDNPEHYQHDYQRLSMGAELIGLTGPAADAEIISMAIQGIQNLTEPKVKIGHIGLMRRLLAHFNLDARTERFLINHIATIKDQNKGKKYVLDRFDRMLLENHESVEYVPTLADKQSQTTEVYTHQMLDVLLDATQRGMTMGGRTRHDIARRLLQKRQRFTEREQVISALEFLERWGKLTLSPTGASDKLQAFVVSNDTIAQSLLDEFLQTLEIIKACGIPSSQIIIQPDLARNWHYYTGIVFDIIGAGGTRLGGGGRYDELVSLISNQENIPSVGFAYYLDEVLQYFQTTTSPEVRQPLSIILTSNNQLVASQLANRLRHEYSVQLIPEHQTEPDSLSVYVEANGEITFNQTTYKPEQLNLLNLEIQRVYDDQTSHNRAAK